MWYIEAYNSESNAFVRQYLLHDMSVEIVKEILAIDDSDFDLPVIAGENEVPLSKLPKFAKYVHEPIEIDESCEYFAGLRAD